VNPVLHYKLDIGLLRTGDAADFILADDLINFNISQTYIDGKLVASNGKSLITGSHSEIINQFNCDKKYPADFAMNYSGEKEINVIEALEGQLITNHLKAIPKVENECIVSDIENDVLKI